MNFRTQLGFVVLLSDDTNCVNGLKYRSYKLKRVVMTVLGGETHAFVNALDSEFTIRHDWSTMLQADVPLNLTTD